jgi:hypothetical protein
VVAFFLQTLHVGVAKGISGSNVLLYLPKNTIKLLFQILNPLIVKERDMLDVSLTSQFAPFLYTL